MGPGYIEELKIKNKNKNNGMTGEKGGRTRPGMRYPQRCRALIKGFVDVYP